MSNTTAFAPGTPVVLSTKWLSPPSGLKHDRRYVVTSVRKTLSAGYQVRVATPEDFMGPDPVIENGAEYGSDWFERADFIPFTLTKDTSREYALHQRSRNLTPEQNEVLTKAANGEEVDVWAFHLAVTAALSLAATRAGQSMARREWTKECRHLLYISGAVIATSLAGLPPVEPGGRSPRIAALEKDLADARSIVKMLGEENDGLRNDLDTQHGRVADVIVEKTDAEVALVEAQRQIARLQDAAANKQAQMEYALSLLDSESRFKVVGFGDAISWLAE